jgi:Tol biopolymer transport system component/predicted Ser/Thr protein kinase
MQPGDQVSHYRIVSKLGAGGMGEVWLARDTQLNRNVAVKVLHPKMAADPEWMKRFIHEARAAAALNHPNIAQIHELCGDASNPMIVMEYVEGRTISELIREGKRSLEEILSVATQVCSALDEAHGKGVVHRDIKPGNIMVTPRGHVKVLDFGLAKKFEVETTLDAQPYSDPGAETQPGEVRGTLRYMSREQCTSGTVDHRSDIYSLGVVLYEMAAGAHAFPGASPALIYDAILNRTPPAPGTLNSAIPATLDRVILKCMQKSPDHRYFSASSLLEDIKGIQADGQTTGGFPSPVGRRLPQYVLAAALLMFAAAVVFLAIGRDGKPAATFDISPLTTAVGTESQPSFSPDGNQVAYAWNGESEQNWDIYVKLIQSGPSLRLTNHPGTDYSPAWSPDGKSIAFLRVTENEGAAFYLLPALGGIERKVADAAVLRTGVEAPFLAWSPDAKTLAITDKNDPANPMRIDLLDLANGTRRRLTNPPPNTFGDSEPVFHPDGKTLFFVRSHAMGIQDVYSIPVSGGEAVRLTHDNRRVYGIAWNPGDQQLVFSSGRMGSRRIWRLPTKGGNPQQVVGIGEDASFLATAPRGGRLAYTRSHVDTNIWSYPLTEDQPPKRLISSTRLEQGAQYSPDGLRIAFASTRTGAWEIYVCDADGSNPVQLTQFADKPAGSPRWSPDGKLISYDGRPGGNADIFVSPAEGGPQRRLTTHPSQDIVPTYSRDGEYIYFGSNRTGRWELWKIPVNGGPETQVTTNGGFHAVESPDGKYLYYARSLDKAGLYRIPIEGGEETPVLESLRPAYWGFWGFHGKHILYVDEERAGATDVQYWLKRYDPASRQTTKVIPMLKRPFNSGLALSPKLDSVLYAQADRSETDIMLVDGFR